MLNAPHLPARRMELERALLGAAECDHFVTLQDLSATGVLLAPRMHPCHQLHLALASSHRVHGTLHRLGAQALAPGPCTCPAQAQEVEDVDCCCTHASWVGCSST